MLTTNKYIAYSVVHFKNFRSDNLIFRLLLDNFFIKLKIWITLRMQ